MRKRTTRQRGLVAGRIAVAGGLGWIHSATGSAKIAFCLLLVITVAQGKQESGRKREVGDDVVITCTVWNCKGYFKFQTRGASLVGQKLLERCV